MATITATVDGEELRWRDRKRWLYPLSLVVPLLPFLAWVGVNRTGWQILWWNGPLWILIGVPILDTIIGTDKGNPPEWAYEKLSSDRYYRVLTYLYAPLQYAGFFWAAWMVTHAEMSGFAKLGLTLTVGSVGGIGIANAHELGHKKDSFEKWLAKIVLAQSAYGHFVIEHNRGHHVRVATPEDPASARFGETFWRFFPRSVIGGVASGWRLEANRMRRLGRRPWNLRNDVVNSWALSVVLFAATIGIFGVEIIPFLAIQAVFGFSLLEVVNYLEHYGLLRHENENGRYERCEPTHSWNSDHIATNVVLYGLERHSDHHANPGRRYQALRTFDEAPQLPSGYGTMIGLACIPPLWRKVMDRRVLELYGGDITKVNLDPRRRDALLARYGAATEPDRTPVVSSRDASTRDIST